MSNTTTVYRSTDTSAPVLTGAVGSLVALLHACLVAGYGTQTAAGWTSAYTATNKEAYRNSTTVGTGFYLNVDDSGPGGAGAREARCTGFTAMTAISTGTGQFPTSAQLAIGTGAVVARKSNTADTTARAWTLIADPTCFYLFMENGDYYSPTLTSALFFGDFFTYSSTDVNNCMLMGRNGENDSSSGHEHTACGNGFGSGTTSQALGATVAGHFVAANQTGVGGSLACGKHIDLAKSGWSGGVSTSGGTTSSQNGNLPIGGYYLSGSAMAYPNPVDNGAYLSPIWIHHNNSLRGYFKGLWAPVQAMPFGHNDTFSGSGGMAGKSFVCQWTQGPNNSSSNGIPGQLEIETSSTWS